QEDRKKWVRYVKGGPYNKWYGNMWTVINWSNDGYEIKNFVDERGNQRSVVRNSDYYFSEGLTYSAAGSKGVTFRYLPKNFIIDAGGPGVYMNKYKNVFYSLGFMNSKLAYYVCNCLNPTVNTNQGDLWRIPFVIPELINEQIVQSHTKQCVQIKEFLATYSIIEPNYKYSPIFTVKEPKQCIIDFYNEINSLLSQVLLNESIQNKTIFSIFSLNENDVKMVLEKEGIPVGDLPVSSEAKKAYQQWLESNSAFPASDEVMTHLAALEEKDDIPRIADFETLYTNNKGWEEFCIQHEMNPVEVWYQFKNANVLPPQRTQALAFELLTDVIRCILAKDDDGIIPLTARAGEEMLLPRIEAEMIERGYSTAQISQIFSLVCENARGGIQAYLNDRFFQQLSDHLNLFMYLPKTPFIWHITSGEHRAIELYVSIYKWSRDAVMRIKSVYVATREAALNERLQLLLQGDATQKAEAVEVKAQIAELKTFTEKLDSLLASGYTPKLDDGVGKNIAPLQKAGLLRCEVLKTTNGRKSQLNKYLNADW
ncbi:MAG: hypothetical protein Q4B58_07150, partial [Bacteroidales bacterium]|nr:hypothetical protein [Bacteroidales bacterium]